MTRSGMGGTLAIAALAAFCACGSEGTDRGPNPAGLPDRTTFDVAWKPATRLLSEGEAKDRLLGIDAVAETYTFRADATAVAALKPGDVAVLAGIALLRVVSVDVTGEEVVLRAKRAALTDAIDRGAIAWDVGFDFARPDRFLGVQIGDGSFHGALTPAS